MDRDPRARLFCNFVRVFPKGNTILSAFLETSKFGGIPNSVKIAKIHPKSFKIYLKSSKSLKFNRLVVQTSPVSYLPLRPPFRCPPPDTHLPLVFRRDPPSPRRPVPPPTPQAPASPLPPFTLFNSIQFPPTIQFRYPFVQIQTLHICQAFRPAKRLVVHIYV